MRAIARYHHITLILNIPKQIYFIRLKPNLYSLCTRHHHNFLILPLESMANAGNDHTKNNTKNIF